MSEMLVLAQKVKTELDRIGESVKTRTDELNEKNTELRARVLELEQKAARRDGEGAFIDDSFRGNDLRALLTNSTELQAIAARKSKHGVIDLPPGYFKAQITSIGITMPDQRPDIVALPRRRLTIRALIPSVPTNSGSVQYLQEITSTNNAAIVSETDVKPESNITYELKTAAVATIAHWIRVANQALSDIPQLQSHIDGSLRYGVAFAEELQLLKGSGVGNNLTGMWTDATAYSGSGGTRIDILRSAITQLSLADFSATGILLHPTSWEKISLMKDTTGRYIHGDPSGPNPPSLWGLPVVTTAAMTNGDFLVGDFPAAALIFDREESRVDISTEDGDNFRINRATIRGEERLALAILRPGALVKGDFGS